MNSKARRIIWGIGFAVIALVMVGTGIIVYRLYHPKKAPALVFSDVGQLNNAVWDEAGRQRYYHISQGSQIMPYDWFVALEQVGKEEPFIAPESTSKYGLIPDPNPLSNPDRLPVGFAKDDPDPITGIQNAGLTCAACHTAQFTYKGTLFRVDGGQGKVDLEGFLFQLLAAVGETRLLPAKFDRFARKVLKDMYDGPFGPNTKKLKANLSAFLKEQIKGQLQLTAADTRSGLKPVKGGYSRIDAFGSGGNQIYSKLDPKNLRTLNSPVKIVALWNTHMYDYVQSNSSFRLPPARNVIEALAARSSVVYPKPEDKKYVSSVRLKNLYEIEETVSKFKPPVWPGNTLGQVNREAAARGEEHYKNLCASCHEPQRENVPSPEDPVSVKYGKTFYVLRLTPLDQIKTDPLDAKNFYERRLDASAAGLGKDVSAVVVIKDVLTNVLKRGYADLGISQEDQDKYAFYRSNLMRVCLAYPARPLAGAWANSPYLHNGSVPNLYQLLLPGAERVKVFYTGDSEFDPLDVGFVSDGSHGGFKFDTSIPGNWNTGHEYGTSLTHDQRMDLIEYLKALAFPDEQDIQLVPPQPNCPS